MNYEGRSDVGPIRLKMELLKFIGRFSTHCKFKFGNNISPTSEMKVELNDRVLGNGRPLY